MLCRKGYRLNKDSVWNGMERTMNSFTLHHPGVFLEEFKKQRYEYSRNRLVLCLAELRNKGFFFTRELPHTEELCMEFMHFITKCRLYLHIKETTFEDISKKTFVMLLNQQAPLPVDVTEEEEIFLPRFQKELIECGLCVEEKELIPVYDTALRLDDTDSLMTVLAKNLYVQEKVGRKNSSTAMETKSYWVGEFRDTTAEPEEGSYLYLVQVRTEGKRRKGEKLERKDSYMFMPEWYFMRSGTPLKRIRLADGRSIQLETPEWVNAPFPRCFDLPVTELAVYEEPKECYKSTSANLDYVFAKLHEEGYMYRRERTYQTVPDIDALIEEQTIPIDAEIGISPEYAKYGLNQIEMEFVNPITRERKELILDPVEIKIGRNNALCSSSGIYTTWFRLDQGACPLCYEENVEKGSPIDEVEIVLRNPVFLTLLEKYELITMDQLRICNLMGSEELRNLFFDFCTYMPDDDEEGPSSEISEDEMRKAARVRRIAKSLRYERVEEQGNNPHSKVEIYANKDRNKAIYLIEKGGVYYAKYLDEFMDVSQALGRYIS